MAAISQARFATSRRSLLPIRILQMPQNSLDVTLSYCFAVLTPHRNGVSATQAELARKFLLRDHGSNALERQASKNASGTMQVYQAQVSPVSQRYSSPASLSRTYKPQTLIVHSLQLLCGFPFFQSKSKVQLPLPSSNRQYEVLHHHSHYQLAGYGLSANPQHPVFCR